MLAVREKCQQVKIARCQISTSNNAGHRFRVNGMRGKQYAGNNCAPFRLQQMSGNLHDQRRCQAVQQYIDQMIADRLETVEQMVQLIAEHAQRPI